MMETPTTPNEEPRTWPTDEDIDAVTQPGREKRWLGDGRQYDRDLARLILSSFTRQGCDRRVIGMAMYSLAAQAARDKESFLAGVQWAVAATQLTLNDPPAGPWVNADDVKKLVREIDVAMNGEVGAAENPSLVDVTAQAVKILRAARGPGDEPRGEKNFESLCERTAAELGRRGAATDREADLLDLLNDAVSQSASLMSTPLLRRILKEIKR